MAPCYLRSLEQALIPTPRPRTRCETASVRFVSSDIPKSGATNQLCRSARVGIRTRNQQVA